MTAVLMIRSTPDTQHTNMQLLCDTIQAYAKKHGQLKQATARMVQLAMLFLRAPEKPSIDVPNSIYAVIHKDALSGQPTSESMAVDEEQEKQPNDEADRSGKEDDRLLALSEHGRAIGDAGLNEDTKMQLMKTLQEVTEGKVFLEVERARVSRLISDQLYARGEVSKAADTLQALAVETFGSMDRREKVEFILEQMRLNVERSDFHRVNMLSRKIHTKFFEDEAQHDLKLLYYELMIKTGMHDDKPLDVCKYYREVRNTPRIQADEEKSNDALRHAIIFLVLAPFDHEQSDLMGRIEATEPLDSVPEYKSLLKCFTTPELMRWPGIEALYGPILRALPVFSGSEEAEKRWKQLHTRVVEYNLQVIAKYYTQIRLGRLAQLLDLTSDEAEEALADLVVKKTIHARIDRPAGLIDFQPRMSDAAVLNNWSSDMSKLLQTVEKVSHLVEKEWAIHRAGLVVKANE